MERRKRIVRDAYDAVAEKYARARRVGSREQRWTERFVGLLPAGARVIDLGCGNGEPHLAAMLARGFHVTAVDFSGEQLARARARCPTATIIQADSCEVDLPASAFDAVLAYDSIFHVPREQHAALFARVARWLVEGGVALLTFGYAPDNPGGELYTEHLGAPTFYSASPIGVSLEYLRDAGLFLLDHDVEANPSSSSVEGGHVIALVRRGRAPRGGSDPVAEGIVD
jgi:SAM-dependent methyltransferase